MSTNRNSVGRYRPDPSSYVLRICRLDRYLEVDPEEIGRDSRPRTA
jgi:hypothetical protein